MNASIQRSMLILPVNVPRFVENAYRRGADAIVLDLEDAVPPSEKANARSMVKDSVALAGRGGAEVLVRVNNEPDLFDDDLDASVNPGLHGIFMPKVESAEDVTNLDRRIAELEGARGMTQGELRIAIHIESPKGLLNIQGIASASSRIESMSLGSDDYCLELGVSPSPEAVELAYPFSVLVTASKASGIHPIGILGTVAEFKDLDAFERAAVRGRQLGATGAYCIHPDQVSILNRMFSPTRDEIDYARRVVEVFEEALNAGRASTSLDGRMIDTPVYKRARLTVTKAEAIEKVERRKREAAG
jgi:citrate lyase subunit beta / citryl-CoA lyase